jgi:hypothetical protein
VVPEHLMMIILLWLYLAANEYEMDRTTIAFDILHAVTPEKSHKEVDILKIVV